MARVKPGDGDPRTGFSPLGKTVTSAQRDQAARAYAQWYLGDPDWWDVLQSAAADPERTLQALEADGFDNVKEIYG